MKQIRNIKILVIDDHPLFVDGLTLFLQQQIENLESIESLPAETVVSQFEPKRFDLVLIDYKLPGINGIEVLKALIERDSSLLSIIISGDEDAQIARDALNEGARGFIPKSLSVGDMVSAIQIVLKGGKFLTRDIRRRVNQLNRLESNNTILGKKISRNVLTKRQQDIVELLAKGYTNKEIARALNLSIDTVKEHVQNVFLKLGVDNRTRCVVRAKEFGLVWS